MQLNTREVARIFEVTESRIERWISENSLPSRLIDSQWMFDRTDLLEWATANQIKFSPALLKIDAYERPSLRDALEFGGIVENVAGTDKASVLRNVVADLPLPEGFDREGLCGLLVAREANATTAVGDGIAIPHARHPMILSIERPILRLCFLAQGVDFGAADRQPVRTLFVLVSPTIRSHLSVLAKISQALRDEAFRNAVLTRAGGEKILAEAARLEIAETSTTVSSSDSGRSEVNR